MDLDAIRREVSPVAGAKTDQLIGAGSNLIGDSDGLIGLVTTLNEGGLGREIDSWIGTGENRAVDPDHLAQAVGNDNIQRVAQLAGVPLDQARTGLAAVLPPLINELTPVGALPASGVGEQLASLKAMVGEGG